jgi:hypothetical protein
MSGEKIEIDLAVIERLLIALNGPPTYIRELQVTRFLPESFNLGASGDVPLQKHPENPINVLERQYEQYVADRRVSDREKSKALSFTPPKSNKLDHVIERAMMEPTLVHALSWLSVWDTTRAVIYAKQNPDKPYETFTLFLFEQLMQAWIKANKDLK